MRGIATLPEDRPARVFTYVRFLKLGLADPPRLETCFAESQASVRDRAAAPGLTEVEIEAEILARPSPDAPAG